MPHKVCFFNQSSVHYRKNIFMLMDQELGIDFYFGDSRKQGAIRELDSSCLKNFKGYFHNIGFGPIYWQNGAIRLLWSDYTDLFTTATHYCLSACVFPLMASSSFLINSNFALFVGLLISNFDEDSTYYISATEENDFPESDDS